MKSILFTKSIDTDALATELGDDVAIDAKDLIEITYYNKHKIQLPDPQQTDYYVVSSRRAASFLLSYNLDKSFYVVGEKSKIVLEKNGYNVLHCADTANSLLQHIQQNLSPDKTFVFFCSNIRRDTLPDGLRSLGHHVKEIVCYETRTKIVDIDQRYDVYVFFSPSGVKSFAQQYDIPKKASIFAIGKTTSDAVAQEFTKKAEFPDQADMSSLLQLIKTRVDAEK